MLRDHDFEHSLKDLMVWREEELLATEILARSIRRSTPAQIEAAPGALVEGAKFFCLSRGRNGADGGDFVSADIPAEHEDGVSEFSNESCDGFAGHAGGNRCVSGEDRGEDDMTFDPGDVDEKVLSDDSDQGGARRRGRRRSR